MAVRTRNLFAGLATAAVLIAAPAAQAANDRGSVQGVVNDASGQPVVGAFVKLKNAERRLTFMVISQDNGQFRADDLPAGQYVVQGVGGDFQSDVSAPLSVAAGASAKIDVALTKARGPMLPPAWPQRIPEAQIPGVSMELPAGDGKDLVDARCTTCHDLKRVVVKRSGHDDWDHIVARMRARMVATPMPDLTDADATTITNYLAANFKEVQPYDANSRLPTALLPGKALHYRAVTYDLANHYAEPHDVASDPQGNAWVAERAGKLGRFDPNDVLNSSRRKLPPGPAPPDRQSLGNPQIDARGMLWVADGPNGRWLSFDTKTEKFLAFAWPQGKRQRRRQQHGAASRRHHLGDRRQQGSAHAQPGQRRRSSSTQSPSAKGGKELPGAYGIAVAGDGSVWWAEDEADMMARVDPETGKVERVQDPVRRPRLPAPHEQRRQRRPLGRAVACRQADEDRPQDQSR